MNPLRIGVYGASGRMGQALLALHQEFPRLRLLPLARELPSASEPTLDLLIDFSVPAGLLAAVEWATQRSIPLLSGTTGLEDTHQAALDALARQQPVLQASNFSLGVAAVRRAAADLAARIDWDCEIVEAHHRDKRDAPSGTALSLARSVLEARGGGHEWQDRRAESLAGARRQPGTLGIASLRGGGVVGDHTLHFLGPGERIELTHRADERAIFARGALHAARRLFGRGPGRYSLDEVLWD